MLELWGSWCGKPIPTDKRLDSGKYRKLLSMGQRYMRCYFLDHVFRYRPKRPKQRNFRLAWWWACAALWWRPSGQAGVERAGRWTISPQWCNHHHEEMKTSKTPRTQARTLCWVSRRRFLWRATIRARAPSSFFFREKSVKNGFGSKWNCRPMIGGLAIAERQFRKIEMWDVDRSYYCFDES